ncbi:hypothetical protein KY360_05850 [Candidatus Woesearchaeota archaeon]|nr:hypothetical protein [Candidatus Woesearchaeota archaeon]
MKYSIWLIVVMFVLLAQPAYSVDLDKDGIPDDQDPSLFDYDNDGMTDEWENAHGTRWDVNDARLDHDNDGISNLQEYRKYVLEGPSITDRLKGISLETETILLISLAIGIAFVITGIALHLHKKRKESKPAEQPRPAIQRPVASRPPGRETKPEAAPPESTPIKPITPK